MELFHFDIETACNYPNWKTFLSEDERGAKKVYKLILENGKKRLRVKVNETGEIIG